MSAKDRQVGGDHYRSNAIQPIDFIMSNGLNFCEGNVVKYVARWRRKNGIEDLKKARQYLDFMIEEQEAARDFGDTLVSHYPLSPSSSPKVQFKGDSEDDSIEG